MKKFTVVAVIVIVLTITIAPAFFGFRYDLEGVTRLVNILLIIFGGYMGYRIIFR